MSKKREQNRRAFQNQRKIARARRRIAAFRATAAERRESHSDKKVMFIDEFCAGGPVLDHAKEVLNDGMQANLDVSHGHGKDAYSINESERWHVIDKATGQVLATAPGRTKGREFNKALKESGKDCKLVDTEAA